MPHYLTKVPMYINGKSLDLEILNSMLHLTFVIEIKHSQYLLK